MDPESGAQPEVSNPVPQRKISKICVSVALRLLALCGTISATLVMALNKETKTMLIATVGTKPVYATVEAKFQDTPANVYFVIVNAAASLHNVVALVVVLFGHTFAFSELRLLLLTLFDGAFITLLSSGLGAATFMAQLAKEGNSHARWNKICDKFGVYCDHGGGALIVAFGGIVFMMVLNTMSIIDIHKKSIYKSSIVP